MPVTINNAYPWGRSFDEYRRMFRLTDRDRTRLILGCADGPASFNAEARRQGGRVISSDPLYRFGGGEIRARVEATYPQLLALVSKERHRFVWDVIRSPEELGRLRLAAMNEFLADYEAGRRVGRYVAAALPALPFADGAFDLALCSHFLFLYSDELPLEYHRRSVLELCRVAEDVRIFPLVDMKGRPSPHVQPILDHLRGQGLCAHLERVPYEFQKGGNQMMRIGRAAGGCDESRE